jgi:hypothetical protein
MASYVGPTGTKGRTRPQVRILYVFSELGIVAASGYEYFSNRIAHFFSTKFSLILCFSALPWWRARKPSNCSLPTTIPGPTPTLSAKS